MRVMLVGGGGREHALAWKLAKSRHTKEVMCVPGNAGILSEPKTACRPIAADDVDALVKFAVDWKPDLVVVGPEAALVGGVVDRMGNQGIPVVGPCFEAAKLEGSKVFAKQLMRQYEIPTSDFHVFDQFDAAIDFVRNHPDRWVIKADGLAAGKGVIPCNDTLEAERALYSIMVEQAFGEAGDRVVIEQFLDGEEVSCIALTDGEEIMLLASSQDHKRAFDGDQGPNTGGMGAYSPAPVLGSELETFVKSRILQPLIAGLLNKGIRYQGVIYAGLMITSDGPRVLEFNVRFGDPETQPLMMRFKSDLAEMFLACVRGSLAGYNLEWDPRPSVCVVMASGGYPGNYSKGKPIRGLSKVEEMEGAKVFHAGTSLQEGKPVTSGGRVLGVTALGNDIQDAVHRAYRAVEMIDFENSHYRRDIAQAALERLR